MKKIIGILSSVGLITTAGVSVVACAEDIYIDEFENDEDYQIPSLDEQPLDLDDALESYAIWYDKVEKYNLMVNNEWREYKSTIENWDNLTSDEQDQIEINFDLNSSNNQRWYISLFWKDTYQYKLSQFVENEKFEIKTPNGSEPTIYIYSNEREEEKYNYSYNANKNEDSKYYKSSTPRTLYQYEKIYEWGILDNPNIT